MTIAQHIDNSTSSKTKYILHKLAVWLIGVPVAIALVAGFINEHIVG